MKEATEVKAAQPALSSEAAGKIDEEIAIAREGSLRTPSQATVHVRLGNLLLKKGSLDESMLSFDYALKLNLHSYDIKTGKGAQGPEKSL